MKLAGKDAQKASYIDALNPDSLADLVRNAVADLRDDDLFERQTLREQAMRADLKTFTKTAGEERYLLSDFNQEDADYSEALEFEDYLPINDEDEEENDEE